MQKLHAKRLGATQNKFQKWRYNRQKSHTKKLNLELQFNGAYENLVMAIEVAKDQYLL